MEKTIESDAKIDRGDTCPDSIVTDFTEIVNWTRKWVSCFYSIPTEIVRKLYEESDDIEEVTPDMLEEYESLMPIWDTMWSFINVRDKSWLTEEDGIKKMADCGFRIYYIKNYGYIFGIDGAGYNFFFEHWIPLYKTRINMKHLK